MTTAVLDQPVRDAATDRTDPATIAETVSFLRRFSSMISVGQNAAYLSQAAMLIETLLTRATDAERATAEQQAVTTTYSDMCKAYEVVVDRQRAEAATLEARLARLTDENTVERTRLSGEVERLGEQLSRAQAERTTVADSLADLTARYASLGETSVIVSVAALQAVRAQFDSLAEEFARHGDVIALAMSDAGRCTVDEMIDANRTEPLLPLGPETAPVV